MGRVAHWGHKGEFLLKFARDRRACVWWLFEAKKKYGPFVLNYMVTSNHVQLIDVVGEKLGVRASSRTVWESRGGP